MIAPAALPIALDPPRLPVSAGPTATDFAALLAVVPVVPPGPIVASEPFPPAAMVGPHVATVPLEAGERPPAARVFNEDGLFARALAFVPDPPVPARAMPVAPLPLPTGEAGPSGEGSVPPPPFLPASGTIRSVQNAPPPGAAPRPRFRAVASVPARDVPTPVVAQPSRPAAAEAPQAMPRSAARPRFLPRPTAPVAVAVHAVGHALEVVARLDMLDAGERLRLADAIAALLARHGHAPGRIAVLARPTDPRNP
ncbi:hypothetical protein [Sphingomonas sp. VNH70]|uniref:hypothetical protein n=1 Tax=Sphingomonas silueang TaxID=3156617 RepID=UPI0032B5821A